MFQNGPGHHGDYGDSVVAGVQEVAWEFPTAGPIRGAATVASDTVYFGSGDGNLYAVNRADGALHWMFRTGGAVQSTPAVADDVVIFTSRDHHVYGLDAETGDKRWELEMGPDLPYEWGFDTYLSSPAIVDQTAYVGGGDGGLYAVDVESGALRWRRDLGSRLRASPAVADGTVYIGGADGIVYAVDADSGEVKQRFQTEGATLDSADAGFDRRALISSPAIVGDILLVGSRDGRLYAFDRATGAVHWTVSHKTSWVISSPAVSGGQVFVGTSDGHFVHALDLKTGEENWRVDTKSGVWSSFALAGSLAYVGTWDGTLHALDQATGDEAWHFHAGGGIYATPLVAGDTIYVGSDDGRMLALRGPATDNARRPVAKRVVYWEDSPAYNWFHRGADLFIRDTLKADGFEVMNGAQLGEFMRQRLEDRQPSIVVFAKNVVPASLLDDQLTPASLLRRFLDVGRVVWLGPTPLAYVQDPESGKTVGIDFERVTRLLNIHYAGPDTRGLGGYLGATVTEAGRRRGLRGWFVPLCAVGVEQVSTVLAIDEYGHAAAWEKTYGGPSGTGLLQLWVDRDHPGDLTPVLDAAESGLR